MPQLSFLFDLFSRDAPNVDAPSPGKPRPPARVDPPASRPPESSLRHDGPRPPSDPPLTFLRSPRARRYILRVLPDGTARVTIPRRGSRKEAERFAAAHQEWIARQRARRHEQARASTRREWQDGDSVLFEGVPTAVRCVREAGGRAALRFGDRLLPHDESKHQAWTVIREHLLREARRRLPGRLMELAAAHGLNVTRVSIRNQRSRWGSCSSTGAISLNWRLVQMPDRVRDYVLLHELMHLRQPNHSRRFWRLVADVCPDFQDSRHWLRAHEALLLDR